MKLPSEEDLRGRLLVPFLAAMNIGPDRVQFERSFTLRLGHHVVTKTSPESPESIRGRLDVLVTNDAGEPLLIVELKRDSEVLTEDDRDQGISYARLLPKIAPFVLVTNGRETHVYDSYTAEALDLDRLGARYVDAQAGRFYPSGDDVRLRYEALQHFVSFSEANLRLFLEGQRRSRMRALRAEDGTREKKYVSSLYTSRGLDIAVDGFLESEDPAFVLTGASGVGKTNEMCALADRLSPTHYVVFFNGTELAHGPSDALADEFNWHFSEHLTAARVCDRIATITARSVPTRRFLIVVDAVDESAALDMPRALSEFANHLAPYAGRIKLLVSLKSSEWPRFARFGGNPSPLAAHTYSGVTGTGEHPVPADRSRSEPHHTDQTLPSPSVVLASFSPRERDDAVRRYSDAFALHGRFSRALLDAVTDPFLLRIVAEAYSGGQAELPVDSGELGLLSTYVRRKLEKLDVPADRQAALREMAALAGAQLDAATRVTDGADDPDGPYVTRETPVAPLISDDELRARLGVRGLDPAGMRAVAAGLVFETVDEYGRRRLGFQYDRVRDFVVAMHVLQLDQQDAESFVGAVRRWSANPLGFAGVRVYMRDPRPAHRLAFEQYAAGRMERFVNTYERLRGELSAVLRESVTPFTRDGTVGAVYTLYPDGWYGLGIYSRRAGDPAVLLHPDCAGDRWRARDERRRPDPDPPIMQTGRNWEIVRTDPARLAAEWMLNGLRQAIKDGSLDDSTSYTLAVEKALAITDRHRKELGLPARNTTGPWNRAQVTPFDLVPLDVPDVQRRVQSVFGAEYYTAIHSREISDRLVAEAQARGEQTGTMSYVLDTNEVIKAQARGRDEAMAGQRFPAPRRVGGYQLAVLAQALDVIAHDRNTIPEHYLPKPDQLPDRGFKHFEASYSDAQLRRLLECLYKHFLTEYDRVIRQSFGALAPAFHLWGGLPVDVEVQYWPPSIERIVQNPQEGGVVEHLYVAAERGAGGAVQVHIAPDDVASPLWTRDKAGKLRSRRDGRRALLAGSSRFMSLVQPSYDIPIEYQGSPSGSHLHPVRSWIFRKAGDRLAKVSPSELLDLLELAADIRDS
jgi:hypothetical protein